MTRKKAGAGNRRPDLGRPAVGYVRVSTVGQGESGISLAAQKAAIQKFAEAMGYQLIEIYEDISSGFGAQSFYIREGLQAALDLTARNNADLIVWGWDRLSRHTGFKKQVNQVLPDHSRIVCAQEGNKLRDASVAATLEHSEKTTKEISRRTKDGMAKKRVEGSVFGNPAITTVVQPMGSAAYSKKANDQIRQIADVLSGLDNPFEITRSEVARLLNEKGLRTLHHKEWTTSRVTEPLKTARHLLWSEDGPESLPTFGMF